MGTVLGRALGRVAPDAPPPPRREGEPVCAARAERPLGSGVCPCELKRRSARWCTHTTAHRHTHTLVSSCSTYPCKMYIYMYARAPQCHTPLAPGHPGRHVTHDTRPTRLTTRARGPARKVLDERVCRLSTLPLSRLCAPARLGARAPAADARDREAAATMHKNLSPLLEH